MYESAAAVKCGFANATRLARAREDTLLASRREDKALRGRNLSAHPEAGHAGEFDKNFSVPEYARPESDKSKAAVLE